MTEAEARQILQKPRFGDEECIEARNTMERVAEEKDLRRFLEGRSVECWCCSGRGTIDCDAMCSPHECPTCHHLRTIRLTADILVKLSLGQLRDLRRGVPETC